jgi:hypothetical protein
MKPRWLCDPQSKEWFCGLTQEQHDKLAAVSLEEVKLRLQAQLSTDKNFKNVMERVHIVHTQSKWSITPEAFRKAEYKERTPVSYTYHLPGGTPVKGLDADWFGIAETTAKECPQPKFFDEMGLVRGQNAIDTRNGWNFNHPCRALFNAARDIVNGVPVPAPAPAPAVSVLGKRPAPAAGSAVTTAAIQAVGVLTAPVKEPSKKPKAVATGRDPNLYAPPASAMKQQARFAGTCQPLKTYLTQRRLWKTQGRAHWDAIAEWCKTPGGRQWLRDCDLHPEGINLDHIHDKDHTPVWHAFNCYFMPGGANSHFGNRSDDIKAKYVGEQAWHVSGAFITWYIEKANELTIDCSKFNPAKALMH